MGILYWKEYSTYFFDENKDHVGNFVEKLAEKDTEKAVEIVSILFERVEEGRGLPEIWFKDGPKLKKVKYKNETIFEFRDYSDVLKLPIRIYFAPDKKRRQLVFLGAYLKHNEKEQKKHIRIVYKRWNRYKEYY